MTHFGGGAFRPKYLILLLLTFFCAHSAHGAFYCQGAKKDDGTYWYHEWYMPMCHGKSEHYCKRSEGYKKCGDVHRAQTTSTPPPANSFRWQENSGRGINQPNRSKLNRTTITPTVNSRTQYRPRGRAIKYRKSMGRVKIQTGDNYSCLPSSVKNQLKAMAQMGWEVHLMSAHRTSKDNHKRGGASGSLHIQCRAADFKVANVNKKTVENYLRANRIGGLGVYCSGRFHIDNGSVREWGGCASKGRRRYRRVHRKAPRHQTEERSFNGTPIGR